uniref:J domain-containing protein n=1 Tax=viral metagenome TaxID=1070528 RepID=A0A6C0BSC7_9ZZZZ
MNVDLNIEHYNLKDILNLFNIDINFDENDLKRAKKITLMTHPDKSKLSKEYFLFYSKAYKKLYEVFTFRKKTAQSLDISYSDLITNYNQVEIKYDEKKRNKEFNEWFNNIFEDLNNDKKEEGYSEWLKGDETELSKNIRVSKTKQEKEKILQEAKKKNRELTIYNDIEETYANISVNSSSLSNKMNDYGNNELFSKNSYQDLKNAYENTLIPVTDEDYTNRKSFKNTFELEQYRKNNEVVVDDNLKNQQNKYILNRRKMEEQEATHIGWELANEVERSQKKNQEFMSKFSLLKYK